MTKPEFVEKPTQNISFLSRFLWFTLRMGLYVIGVITSVMFFFSFIGIGIGLGFFLIDKQHPRWRHHGLALAFASGFSQLLGHVGSGLAPLYLAAIGSFAILGVYGIYCLLERFLFRRIARIQKYSTIIMRTYQRLPKVLVFFLMLVAVLTPISFWASVSLNFQVMFDNNPRVLWIHSPSTVSLNESFPLTIEAWDSFERLSAVYSGTVTFTLRSYNFSTGEPLSVVESTIPLAYTFTGQFFGSDMAYSIRDGKDNGKHTFSARINTPGIHYFLVNDSVTARSYYSNPILVLNYSTPQPRLYWGDLHTHSMLSDGSGTPEHAFYYARQVACLEFHALTDHSEILAFLPFGLDILERATDAAYIPGQFVTFHGIEWTDTKTGHYTLIFSGDELLKRDISSYFGITHPASLWAVLDDFTASSGCRALALPHHTTKKSYMQDWTYLNPKYVKIAEVSSVHGDFLYEQRHPLNYRGAIDPPAQYTNGSSITDALRMGFRLTLYAGSDTHDGRPGHTLSHTPAFVGHQRPLSIWHTRNEHPYPGGITAAWAMNLTREGIFSALENQRIFAVSDFGRPILNFTINGVGVGDGSTLVLGNTTAPRNISIFLAQDGAFGSKRRGEPSLADRYDPAQLWNATLELLKNGELFASLSINTPVVFANFTDTSPITGTSYGSESCILKNGNYYINGFSNNPVDPNLLNTNGTDFYILRVVHANGRMAWAGPIWVEV
ncbi:MAG: DUF3604 domain-containing protein [Promethearchaeota archaeon]|nr:MAG: DUF3604 domain-containing protein [Candidatus Lokiarchaeota archaeon]